MPFYESRMFLGKRDFAPRLVKLGNFMIMVRREFVESGADKSDAAFACFSSV